MRAKIDFKFAAISVSLLLPLLASCTAPPIVDPEATPTSSAEPGPNPAVPAAPISGSGESLSDEGGELSIAGAKITWPALSFSSEGFISIVAVADVSPKVIGSWLLTITDASGAPIGLALGTLELSTDLPVGVDMTSVQIEFEAAGGTTTLIVPSSIEQRGDAKSLSLVVAIANREFLPGTYRIVANTVLKAPEIAGPTGNLIKNGTILSAACKETDLTILVANENLIPNPTIVSCTKALPQDFSLIWKDTTDGTQILSITASDASGDATPSSTASFVVDLTAPTVSIVKTSGNNPASGEIVRFTATFSEAVAGFSATKVAQAGDATGLVWSVSGTGPSYSISAIAPSQLGKTIQPLIAAAKVTDLAGNPNLVSTYTGNAATIFLAPAGLSYLSNPGNYTRDAAIVPNTPTSSGGVIATYTVSPALPAGLSLNTTTGEISGTPTAATASANYTITATNAKGSTTVVVAISVTLLAPSGLVYAASSPVYVKDIIITQNTPTSGGGAAASYAVAPTLPAGLSLNTTTGVISGTPTVVTAGASYTVTATNTAGSTTASLTITVNPAAPSSLSYSSNSATYTQGTAITNNSPTSSGGAITSYAAFPALPTGLSLSTMTGVISGTPTVVTSSTSYTVTATNVTGSTTRSINITVVIAAPSGLGYSTSSPIYLKDALISANSPTSSGGAVASYAVSPPLPTGLSLNTTTGVISGTPTAVTANASYTITATNATDSTTASVAITVNPAAPSNLSYSSNSATYTQSTTIIDNQPTSSGGAVASYAVSPALPAGLSLHSTTGVISGTPTAPAAVASYTITATNVTGSTTKSVSITVILAAPSSLVYSSNPATYVKDSTITANSPMSGGGAVVSYAVSPALPAGLNLNTTTGVISGIPTAITANASYTITATNTTGSTTASVAITVNPTAPSGLVYSPNPAVYTKNIAITESSPSSSGGAVASYAVSPSLPTGLALNTTTGIITGTPTVAAAAASYTITATNATGSTTATLSIRTYLGARFAYSTNQVSNSISIYTVDQVTGKLRANGVAAAGSSPRSIAVDPTGRFAFVANSGANTVSVFSISTAGKLTLVEHKATGSSPYVTTVDPSGRFVYVVNESSNNTSAYSINQTTGALTELSGSPLTVGTAPPLSGSQPLGSLWLCRKS